METLEIHNFGGIQHAVLHINKYNIFIGPGASGKSITAKLLFYFREFTSRLLIRISKEENITASLNYDKGVFMKYFPFLYLKEDFMIKYSFLGSYIIIKYNDCVYGDDLSIDISEDIRLTREEFFLKFSQIEYEKIKNEIYELLVQKNLNPIIDRVFIPASRSFFSIIKNNILDFLIDDKNYRLDYFIVKFGEYYENILFNYEKYQINKDDFIVMPIIDRIHSIHGNIHFLETSKKDNTLIQNASSSQQELLPMLHIVRVMSEYSNNFSKSDLFIEEPETHLFPSTQKEVIDLIFEVMNKNKGICVMTTHSPYVTSSINNLIYKGIINEKLKNLGQNPKFSETESVDPSLVSAYLFNNGTVTSIMDKETGLIDAGAIDEISNTIADEFYNLIDINMEIDNVIEKKENA